MKFSKRPVALVIAVVITGAFIVAQVLERRDDSKYERRFLPPVESVLYTSECSSCHFLYLPGLLPAGSWKRIVEDSGEHFGHELHLEAGVAAELVLYLGANSAETTGAKRSGRILDSLEGATPKRITETPYIKKKHQGIKAIIYRRDAIKSFSNCIACHTTAKEGNFREANVKIPKL
ncbi:MAG: diheme cytochrome c [Proteobacteria bacterium]|nr:diheme cytochrome c [Pseudomonadota bacterium]